MAGSDTRDGEGAAGTLQIVTRFTDRETFVQRFAKMVDSDGMIVATRYPRAVGTRLPFVVALADRTPVIEGIAEVTEVQSGERTASDRTPLRLRFLTLSDPSRELIERMVRIRRTTSAPGMLPPAIPTGPGVDGPDERSRRRTEPMTTPSGQPRLEDLAAQPTVISRPMVNTGIDMPAPVLPVPSDPTPVMGTRTPTPEPPRPPIAPPPPQARPPAPPRARIEAPPESVAPEASGPRNETRAPGSPFIVVANPLAGLDDDAIKGFVDCTLFDERGTNEEREKEESGDAAVFRQLAALFDRSGPTPAPADFSPGSGPTAAAGGDTLTGVTPNPLERSGPTALFPSGPVPIPLPADGSSPSQALTSSGPVPVPMTPSGMTLPGWPPQEPPRRPLLLYIGVAAMVSLALAGAVVMGMVVGGWGRRTETVVVPAPALPPVVAQPAPVVKPPEEPAAPEPVGCRVQVRATPRGAEISVDGKVRGAAPALVDGLPCGEEVRVVVAAPHYEKFVARVTPRTGESAVVDARLIATETRVAIWSKPPGAEVTVNGKPSGKTPLTAFVPTFTSVRIEIARDGYTPWSTVMYVRGPYATVSPVLEASSKASASDR